MSQVACDLLCVLHGIYIVQQQEILYDSRSKFWWQLWCEDRVGIDDTGFQVDSDVQNECVVKDPTVEHCTCCEELEKNVANLKALLSKVLLMNFLVVHQYVLYHPGGECKVATRTIFCRILYCTLILCVFWNCLLICHIKQHSELLTALYISPSSQQV